MGKNLKNDLGISLEEETDDRTYIFLKKNHNTWSWS